MKILFKIAFVLSFPVTWWTWTDAVSPTAVTPVPAHTKAFYVNDYGGYLSEDTEDFIIQHGPLLAQQTGAQVAVAIVPDTGEKSLETYSYEMASQWGIGDKNKNNGILILFTTGGKPRVRMEVGRGLEGDINDAKAGRLLDDFAVEAKNKREWNRAVVNTWQATMAELYRIYKIDPPLALVRPHAIVEKGESGKLADGVLPAKEETPGVDPDSMSTEDIIIAVLGAYIGYWLCFGLLAVVVWMIMSVIELIYGIFFGGGGSGYSGGGYSSSSSGSSYSSGGGSSFGGYSGGGGSFGGGGASR